MMAVNILPVPQDTLAADTMQMAASADTMSMFEILAKGGLVMVPITLLSLLAVYLFIERLLHLRVDAGFRYPFSYGDLSATFGEAKGFGFDAGLILGGELDVGFAYAARFSVDYFMPQFSGFPGGTVPPNPGAAQGRDATDLAYNFHVMVGWAF